MASLRPQSGFAGFSDPGFQQALQQALPLLEMLVEIAHTYSPENSETIISTSCEKCPDRNSCGKPCEAISLQLPAAHGGKGYKENTIGLDFDQFQDNNSANLNNYEKAGLNKSKSYTLKSIKKTTFLDVFEGYDKSKHIFTKKQWEVVSLYYKDGKTIVQIAKELGKAPSTVGSLLNRTRKRKKQYDKERLKEILELNKKLNSHKAE
jgi:predicted DNA-binding protein YlxM (UPF0122 family)